MASNGSPNLNNTIPPIYSKIWFNPKYFEILDKFKGLNNLNFLEIGSFEGYGTNYFVDKYLTGANCLITCIDPWIKYSVSTVTNINGYDNLINEETYNIFKNNTMKNQDKIIIKKGFSNDILPQLDKIYDFIYVDGDHSEKTVWNDAINSFAILKNNGILIFDDYTWNEGDKSPKKAIDRFLLEYKDYIKVLNINYQVCIMKIGECVNE